MRSGSASLLAFLVTHRCHACDVTPDSRNDENSAWAAGYFDGDGTFSLAAGYPAVSIGGVDPELLERFKSIVGAGNIIGPFVRSHPRRWSKRPQYFFQAYREARSIAEQLWPFLGGAKRKQTQTLERRALTWKGLSPLGSSQQSVDMSARARLSLAWAAGFLEAEVVSASTLVQDPVLLLQTRTATN